MNQSCPHVPVNRCITQSTCKALPVNSCRAPSQPQGQLEEARSWARGVLWLGSCGWALLRTCSAAKSRQAGRGTVLGQRVCRQARWTKAIRPVVVIMGLNPLSHGTLHDDWECSTAFISHSSCSVPCEMGCKWVACGKGAGTHTYVRIGGSECLPFTRQHGVILSGWLRRWLQGAAGGYTVWLRLWLQGSAACHTWWWLCRWLKGMGQAGLVGVVAGAREVGCTLACSTAASVCSIVMHVHCWAWLVSGGARCAGPAVEWGEGRGVRPSRCVTAGLIVCCHVHWSCRT
jgi:hypothetical protein